MILFLYGPDTYRSRQRLAYYREGFKKKYDPRGLNIARLDGEKLTLEELRTHVGQAGFLSSKRFIVVENLLGKNKKKNIQKAVLEYLDTDWADDNVLVFWEEDVAGKRRGKKNSPATDTLLGRLLKAKAEEFPPLAGEQLNAWIRAAVRERGGRIAAPAVLELASLVGSDLWSASTNIDKLIAFCGQREIAAADVRTHVTGAFDENIFHFTDAIAARDAKRSMQLLHDQLDAGNHELYILTMLTRQFRILLQVREIIDQEPNYHTVATRLGIHPFVAQKAIRDARRFTLQELKTIYAQLLEIDLSIKTGRAEPRLLLDLFVARTCGAQ
ncbi:MAG: DNA polymerase III subunit delta [Patescibacteria group bacterium]|nr:DNA polymerase III subunit delta [Patescibacteria group bacterium]MDD5715879.1 DNA polymerase III subunit delta [Patescibacteria group bacterium]